MYNVMKAHDLVYQPHVFILMDLIVQHNQNLNPTRVGLWVCGELLVAPFDHLPQPNDGRDLGQKGLGQKAVTRLDRNAALMVIAVVPLDCNMQSCSSLDQTDSQSVM